MSYPMEEPFCESWDEARLLCNKRYPKTCPHREVCLEMAVAETMSKPMKNIESIHLSTLKSALAIVIGDCKSSDASVMAEFIVDKFFDGLGKAGKIGLNHGLMEYYSPHACLDFPHENGWRLFILEG